MDGMQQYMSPEQAAQAIEDSKRKLRLSAKLFGIDINSFDLIGNYVLVKVNEVNLDASQFEDEIIPVEFKSSLENYGVVVKLGVDPANRQSLAVGINLGDKVLFDPKASTNRTGLFYDKEDPNCFYLQIATPQLLGIVK